MDILKQSSKSSPIPHQAPSSGHWSLTLAWMGRGLCAGLLMVAAVSKIVDPLPTSRVVEVLEAPEIGGSSLVTVGIVAGVEVFLGLGILLLPASRAIVVALIVTLLGFTAVLLRLLWLKDAPGCACLGFLFETRDAHKETLAGVLRNIGLMLTAIWLLGQKSPRSRSGLAVGTSQSIRSSAVGRRAFTLPELLVCIGIVALVISLSLPAVARARSQARVATALSMLRQVHMGTLGYAAENRDSMPFLATPMRPWERFTVGSTVLNGAGYFRQSSFVLSLVYPGYLDSRDAIVAEGEGAWYPEEVVFSRFDMTDTAFAAPSYWRGDRPPDDLSLYVGMRVSDALFPAQKGLFLDHEASRITDLAPRQGHWGPWLISRVDGSAAAEGYDREYRQPFVRPYECAPIPGMMMTVDGFAGRDF